jgi:hypothetical protein
MGCSQSFSELSLCVTSRRALSLAALVIFSVSCSGYSTPSALPLPTPGGGGNGTVTGSVVAQDDRAPVSGATVTMSGVVKNTDAQGAFTLTGVPDSGSGGLTVQSPGHLLRGVALELAPSRNVTVDVIRLAPPFSLGFYQTFVRNGLESLTLLETRRWTMNPSFYFVTTVADSELTIPADILKQIQDNFARSVVDLSGGRYQVAAFESGPEIRLPEEGWVIVSFASQLFGGALGRSSVGGNMGTMALRYDPGLPSNPVTNPHGCSSPVLSIADHEITHTMGYWHTADVLNDTFSGPGCSGARPEYVRYHANVMYSRPRGNKDPDIDPVDALQSQSPVPAKPTIISCFPSSR